MSLGKGKGFAFTGPSLKNHQMCDVVQGMIGGLKTGLEDVEVSGDSMEKLIGVALLPIVAYLRHSSMTREEFLEFQGMAAGEVWDEISKRDPTSVMFALAKRMGQDVRKK